VVGNSQHRRTELQCQILQGDLTGNTIPDSKALFVWASWQLLDRRSQKPKQTTSFLNWCFPSGSQRKPIFYGKRGRKKKEAFDSFLRRLLPMTRIVIFFSSPIFNPVPGSTSPSPVATRAGRPHFITRHRYSQVPPLLPSPTADTGHRLSLTCHCQSWVLTLGASSPSPVAGVGRLLALTRCRQSWVPALGAASPSPIASTRHRLSLTHCRCWAPPLPHPPPALGVASPSPATDISWCSLTG
jgi:hypothetical protein